MIYLKTYLIQISLTVSDIDNSLLFISKYNNKNFIDFLEIIKNNYNKINSVCFCNQKSINIYNYINQTIKDDSTVIKEYLTFIFSQKKINNYTTIYFDMNIFDFYINNKYPSEFLNFIENKLFETSINFNDINDSLIFSKKLKNGEIIHLLETINKNFENIQKICKNEKKNIFLSKYVINNKNDDLLKIKELITFIVDKEKMFLYNSIIFEKQIWIPYLDCDDLDNLKLIKKIILKCKEIDDSIDIESIGLEKKIHDIGFNMIKKGELIGEKLILFLGEDETFYNAEKFKNLENENNSLQEKNKELQNKVKNLIEDKKHLKKQLDEMEVKIENINNEFSNKIKDLNNENENMKNKINKMDNYFTIKKKKIDSIKTNNNG